MMINVFNIFCKEFGSYFRSGMAYFMLMIYAVLSMVAAFFGGYYFQLSNYNLFSFFYFQPEVFTLLIPALTMKLWADERRFGTLELLLSQPLGYTELVAGKFLAAWGFCLLMLLASVPLWITTAQYMTLDNQNILFGYFSCLLAAGALCAIGCTVSSFSANPVTAYIAALAVCLLLKVVNFDFILKSAAAGSDLFIRISHSLNFDSHFASMISGQINAGSIAYFIILTLLGLWLNVVSIGYKRS